MKVSEVGNRLMYPTIKIRIIEAVMQLPKSGEVHLALADMQNKSNCRICFAKGLHLLIINNVTEI